MVGVSGSLLWRYSVSDPSWIPEEIQGIDYAGVLVGLAAHVFGTAFLEEHNDFAAWLTRAR
jgi:hypothetical protein